MAAIRSKLAAAVYRYLGDVADAPAPEGVPLQTVMQVLSEIEDEMLRDYDLSDQNRRVSKFEIPLSGTTFAVPRADFSGAVYAYLRVDPDEHYSYPVEIVNHGAVNQAAREGRLAVGFYGTPPLGELSWEPDASHRLRVWYDRSGEDAPSLAGETEIAALYDSYLALQAAAQCRELGGLEVGDVMKARLVRSAAQWQRAVTSSRQQGVAQKPMAFRPRTMRRWVPFDRSRFFIP